MAIPAKAAAAIAQNINSLFKSSPSVSKFPKTSFEPNATSLWRGIRSTDQFEVRPSGDLVLYPGKNFGGKTTGISFTDDQNVALRYATRQPETPVPSPDGIVFRVRRDIFEDVDDFLVQRTTKPKLKYEGIEGEHAYYTDNPFVVPKGAWEVKTPEKRLIDNARKKMQERAEELYNMDDKEFMKRYGDNLSRMELEEHLGGGESFFGFNAVEWRHQEALNSDPIEQLIFRFTKGEPDIYFDWALNAKINSKPKAKQDSYLQLLNKYANENEVAGLYGPDWFLKG